MSLRTGTSSSSDSMSNGGKKPRILILDGIRGIAITGMILHHFLIDLELYMELDIPFINTAAFASIRMVFVFAFILISGACSHFSRNNIRRSLFVILASGAVTAATFYYIPENAVVFGILHMLGVSMLLYGLFERALKKIPFRVGALLWGAIYIVYTFISEAAPRGSSNIFLVFGFPSSAFQSADYFPLFPWFFLFLAGASLGGAISKGLAPKSFYTADIPVFSKIGRYTLPIYLLHQPVMLGLIFLIQKITGTA